MIKECNDIIYVKYDQVNNLENIWLTLPEKGIFLSHIHMANLI